MVTEQNRGGEGRGGRRKERGNSSCTKKFPLLGIHLQQYCLTTKCAQFNSNSPSHTVLNPSAWAIQSCLQAEYSGGRFI